MSIRIQAVTKPPRHHFFGYYGIDCWNSTGEYLACLETDFHEHAPEAGDVARVGIVEIGTGEFHRLAETQAFNLQQGAMLHWLGSDATRLLAFNHREEDRFVAVVLDIHSGKRRVLPRPIAGISHNGRLAASLNYAKLYSLRRVVGYAGLPDCYCDQPHPDSDGLFIMDPQTGKSNLVISYQDMYEFLEKKPIMDRNNIWFNHAVFNTNGTRLCFVVRWYEEKGIHTTLVSAGIDGSNLNLITDIAASHFTWRTETEIIGWLSIGDGEHHYSIDDTTGEYAVLDPDQLDRNGHMSFTPDGRWMLSDTYPNDCDLQELYLWRMDDRHRVVLGRFLSPKPFRGDIRCDLHPRWSRDYNQVSFDSIHEGTRQVYVADVSNIVLGD